jgi:hypothetical protein
MRPGPNGSIFPGTSLLGSGVAAQLPRGLDLIDGNHEGSEPQRNSIGLGSSENVVPGPRHDLIELALYLRFLPSMLLDVLRPFEV